MSLKYSRSAWFSAFTSFALALVLVCVPARGVAQTGAAAPVASRLTQPIDEGRQVALKGTVHRLAVAANDRGAVGDGVAIERLQVMLQRSPAQETALRQLIQEMHQPGSANYHKWLTPAQFGEQFGPSDADIATLSSWLSSHGFTVTKVNPGKLTLEISGNAGQFQKTFHAAIHKYEVNGQIHTANASDPSIPAALAPVFGGFVSINNFQVKSYEKVLGNASYEPATHKATPSWTEGSSTDPNLVLAPGDFAVQYDLNPLYTAGVNGAGQTIAIINEANISVALVNEYRTLFGLPANAPNVIIDGNDPGIDGLNNPDGPNGASVESYLDVEQSGAVAPNATIDLVIAADTTVGSGLFYAAEHAVYTNIAPVLSMSFGNCEAGLGTTNTAVSQLWEQAAAQGQTVMVSTGDAGSAACDNDNSQEYAVNGQAVNGLASTPWNVAVGGTDFYYTSAAGQAGTGVTAAELTQLGQYWSLTPDDTTPTTTLKSKVPEQPWNNSQFATNLLSNYNLLGSTSIAGGGGGASNCATGAPTSVSGGSGGTCQGYPKPAWQAGAGVPADGVRDLPDVSLFAASGINLSYYPICATDGDCGAPQNGVVQISGVGGTSASTPAFAGIMALVNQKYGRQGQADFILYPLATQFGTSFNDVVNGTNSVPCAYSPASPECIAVSSALAYTVDDPTYGSATEGEIGTGTTAEYNAGTGYDLASGLGTIDANNLVTNWSKVTFTPTTTTLAPLSGTLTSTTAVTITGTVSPNVSSGVVELMTTSSEPLQAGQGTFNVTNGTFSGTVFLPGGTYTVYASYSGSNTDAASSSTPVQVTVSQGASSLTLSALNEVGSVSAASGSSATYGTQMLLTATASGAAPGAKATGTVTFTDNGTLIATEPIGANGAAVLNWAPAIGAHSVTAAYAGDASYTASTSTAFTLTVTKNTPDLNLYTSGSPSANAFGALSGTTTLTAQVSNSASDGLVNNGYPAAVPVIAPTGVVTVTGLGSATLTFPSLQAALDSIQSQGGAGAGVTIGTATVTVPTTVAQGQYNNVTINYPGDSNYMATSVANVSVLIETATGTATTTTATASTSQTSRTAGVVVSGSVTGASNHGVPTGSVIAVTDGYEVASYTLGAGTGASAPYGLVLNNADLTPGVNVVTLQYYPGTSSPYAPSATTVTISNGSTAFYTLTNSGAIDVAAGATGTSNVLVTPTGGFTGSVALGCVVTSATAAATPTCSIAASAAISGISPASTPLTITTTAATAAGTYVVTVTGTSGGQVFTTSVPVVVTTSVSTTPAISLSNSGAITLPAAGGNGTSTITVTPAGGFTGAVALGCTVAPTTGTSVPTCTVTSPVTVSGTTAATSTLTVTSTGTTTAGGYTVTVTGTATGVTAATTMVAVTVSSATASPTVALSNSGAITVVAGATTGNSSTITVTPGGGFTGPVALTCAVTPTSGTSVPTCAITGSPVTISGTTAGTASVAITTTSTTTAEAYTVTVSGTASGVTIAPTSLSLTVQAAVTATPTVTLGGGSSITIASAGGSGTSSISVTPGGGFTGSVSLACSVGSTVTYAPTCSITSPVSLSGTSAGTATLTVNTTAASAALEMPRMRMLPIGGGIAAATLLFFLVPMKRRRVSTLLGALVLIAVVGFSAGCGGGGSTPVGTAGTPTGTYSVTVSGTATGVTIAPITVSVTVQ